MQITLVRHIKTVAPEGMCYGHTDVALPPGHQAKHAKAAASLKEEKFDFIFSSPLQRCALLAKTIAGETHSVVYDDRLKELDFGQWEQQMWSDIEKQEAAKAFFDDYVNNPPPAGESFRQMMDRIAEFLAEIQRHHGEKNLLIVTHGGPIRVIHALLNGTKPEEMFKLEVGYGAIIKIDTQEGSAKDIG